MAESRANAVWEGDLVGGSGSVSVASGAFPEQAVTWAARTNRPDPKTSPEELIAAAHAACYAMALLAHARDRGPHARARWRWTPSATSIRSTAAASRSPTSTWPSAAASPGLDQAEFQRLAEEGERGCPVSNALRGNVEIGLSVTLEA